MTLRSLSEWQNGMNHDGDDDHDDADDHAVDDDGYDDDDREF